MSADGLPWVWGATAEEVARRYPADDQVAGRAMTRAVPVAAPPSVLWRWLCQLAEAPYSYDLVDNLGRRSPRELTPGGERLSLGQRMAVVFRLTSYDEGRQWTGVTGRDGRRSRLGRASITYAAEPAGPGASRLVCRMVVSWPRPVADALAWGDLVMMRKQLHTLRDLAEGSAGRRPVVRPATSDDIDAVVAFGRRVVPPHHTPLVGAVAAAEQLRWWTPERFRPAVDAGRLHVAVADEGLAGVVETGELGGEQVVWKLYVAPDHRGSGLGVDLLARAVAGLPAGTPSVLLEHLAGNARAAAFYEREGFAVERVDPAASGDPAAAVVWRRRPVA